MDKLQLIYPWQLLDCFQFLNIIKILLHVCLSVYICIIYVFLYIYVCFIWTYNLNQNTGSWIFVYYSVAYITNSFHSEVTKFCPTLCNPMDYSLPGFFIHGIFQATVLKWVTISFSRGSSWPRGKPRSPALQVDTLPSEPPGNLIVDVPIYIFTKSLWEFQFSSSLQPLVFYYLQKQHSFSLEISHLGKTRWGKFVFAPFRITWANLSADDWNHLILY